MEYQPKTTKTPDQSKIVTGEMLKQIITDAFSASHELNEVKRRVPKAYETTNSQLYLDGLDIRSDEEILKDRVRSKWLAFKNTLSHPERVVLSQLLGLDEKRYSIRELESLQSAIKGKGS